MGTFSKWKRDIQEIYKIQHVSLEDILKLSRNSKVLWTTRCSRTKLRKKGVPTELYDSYITRYFYRFVLERHLPFAVISDKYGLHFSDESLPYYNLHPSALSAERKKFLGEQIRIRAKDRGFTRIVFYNNSPLMSKPYFEMLSNASLKVFFTTRLIKE